jgi:hypothetical protein
VARPSRHARPGPFRRFAAAVSLPWHRANRNGRIVIASSGVVVVALIATGVGFALASGPPRHKVADPTTTSTTIAAKTVSTQPKVHVVSHDCPLTGTRAPRGVVPQRPALGVKIGNDPSSRPQSGLLQADIVYEEMAEGGITRYLAIFQCQVPAVIGPVRSVRWDDWHLLKSYGHPILAFSGGIDQWDAAVANLGWLFDANGSEGTTQSAYYRTDDRVPPWNYYTSAKALWGLDGNHTPPPPQFTYSTDPAPGSRPAAGATIEGFATGSDVDWTWSPRLQAWMRSYDNVPDVDASGPQLQATNVIIEEVPTQPGPYPESGTVPDTDSLTQGSGPAYILRNGMAEPGTWNCPKYGDITQYRFANGKTMPLAPGNTWIELVPNTGYPVKVPR